MPSATSPAHSRPPSVAMPKAWIMMAGGAVIAAQLIAVALVVQHQVDQAAQKQAAAQQQTAQATARP